MCGYVPAGTKNAGLRILKNTDGEITNIPEIEPIQQKGLDSKNVVKFYTI